MVVQHNMPALTANRYYTTNNSSLSKSLEKLSSGYAINRAGDNAAGLAVSEKMRAQIAGLTQASKNAEDGISMVQTYEGALQETDSILQRMRTIAVQSANGSYQNDVDRDALQLEFDQLNDELNQIADTDFNGVVVLNGGVMADGTVANDTTKVADRPEVPEIKTSPNAAFTYNSSVNGTVDSAGNGSLSINGVSIKLNGGSGTSTLGSASTGMTTYNANLSVTSDGVNGKVAATETYKVDASTTKVEIHGSNYSLSDEGLVDSKGDAVGQIDGMAVSYNRNSDGTVSSIELKGTYVVDNNKVTTSKSFTASSTTNGIASTSTGKSASISATNVTYNDDSGNATGNVVVNGTKISVTSGGTGSNTRADSTNGDVTYTVSDFKADGDTDVVTMEVEASGTLTLQEDQVQTGNEKAVAFTTDQGTANALDTNGDVAELTVTDSVSGETLKVYLKNDNSTMSYSLDGSNYTALGGSDVELYATANGDLSTTAGADSLTKLTLKSDLVKSDKTIDSSKVELSNSFYTGNGISETGNTKVYVGLDTTKNVLATTDTGAEISNDKTTVALSNGLKITGSTGAVEGTFTVEDKLEYKNVGSFKVSTGVSTSDTYNHGTANLTFADNMTLQVGARSKDAVTFNFSYTTNGIGNLKADLNASARGLGTDQVSVKNQEDANAAIDAIDNAINKVSMIRGTFGAIQNRLEHKISNINTNAENLTAAESRIRDTQMDQEMMKFTSAQILSQASQSMLAQANSLPQGVLQLLG